MSSLRFKRPQTQEKRAAIEQATRTTALTKPELAAAVGMTVKALDRYIAALCDAEQMHVADWRPGKSDTVLLPCYLFGPGEDMPRPPYHKVKSKAVAARKAQDPAFAAEIKRRDRERYQRRKENDPEGYKAKLAKAAANKAAWTARRKLEQAEAERKQAADAARQAARKAARHIKDEDERERFVAVQSIIANPQPDPMVGLFFGKRT